MAARRARSGRQAASAFPAPGGCDASAGNARRLTSANSSFGGVRPIFSTRRIGLRPSDFLEVTDADFLAVTGARVQYERGPTSIRCRLDSVLHAEPHSADWAPVDAFAPDRPARPASSIWPPRFPRAHSTADGGTCSGPDSSSLSRLRWIQSPAAVHRSSRSPVSRCCIAADLCAFAHGRRRRRRRRSDG